MSMITLIIFLFVFGLCIYDDYLYDRGRHFWAVYLRIDGESIEDVCDYRVYANHDYEAKMKALKLFCEKEGYNYPDIYRDIDVVHIEKIK